MKNKILFIILSTFAISLCACGATAPHEHTFDSKWDTNESSHWHKATCEHTDLTKDAGAHVDSNSDGKCDVCLYEIPVTPTPHEHTFDTKWDTNESSHWHKATCEHTDLTKDAGAHIDSDSDGKCDVCLYEMPVTPVPHEHTFSNEWSKNKTSHWHAATCEHTELTKDLAAHTFGDGDICTVCNYEKEIIPVNYYTVTFDSNGGSFIDSQIVEEGKKIDKPTDPIKHGYSLTEWKHNGEHWNFNDSVVSEDMTLLAIWNLDTYTVNYVLDGGINNPLNPETYTFEESKALFDPFKVGHTFVGWYLNDELVDEIPLGTYGDITLTATWVANDYTVIVVSEDESKGTVTGSGSYTYKTNATIEATPKEHYYFAGWYERDTLVSLDATYTFEVPARKVTYEAHFALVQYNVEVKVREGDEYKGTVSGSGYYDYGSYATVVATPNPGYQLDGWYVDGSYDCSDLQLRIKIGAKDVTCEARFKPVVYTIEYNLMGGHISSSNPGIYTIEDTKTFVSPTKEGYTFLGWYNKETKIESIIPGMYGDLYLVAHWTGSDIKVELDTASYGGTVVGAGTYKCGETVTISAYANKGYSFMGWYDNWFEEGGTLISTDENYTFTVPTKDVKYYAHWSNNSYKVSIINSDPKKGTATGEGRYDYLSEFTLEATPNEGYSFAGWYLEGSLIGSTNPYTQKMYDRDLAFEVRWSNNKYNLTVESSDETKGTVSGAGSFEYTSRNYIIATPKENYDFEGWYVDGVMVSPSAKYQVVMPNHDIHFVAKWKLHNYKITYNLEGGVNNPNNPSTYTIEDSVTFLNPTKEGYTFVAWYKDGAERRTETIPVGSSGDVHLNARWNINDYPVYTYSSDESKGTVKGGFKRYVYGTQVTVTATPKENCFFKGWYTDPELTNLVSTEEEYKFKQPAKILNLYAKFNNEEDEQREWDIRHGAIPTIDLDNNTVSYGLYPQTHVKDAKLIHNLESLDESYIDTRNGWYYYEDNYYVKSKSWVFIPTDYTKFKDGTQILDEEYYWYRCDPIVWDILSNNDGTYSLISREILDRDIFGSSYIYADNNYAKSSVRNWLNGAFYNSAFALGKNYIQTTTVDNSASTTPCNPNKWCCENTLDKIYLPSYVECMNLMPSPRAQTTDWVRARHIDFDHEFHDFPGCGIYWTRSPMEIRDIDTAVAVIYCSGASDYDYTYQEVIGIRPCMTIKIA